MSEVTNNYWHGIWVGILLFIYWAHLRIWHRYWEAQGEGYFPILRKKFSAGMKSRLFSKKNPKYALREAFSSAKPHVKGKILPLVIGRDAITTTVLDLAELPHLLVAGTTGWGKSNFLNNILASLEKFAQKRYDLWLIDPKQQEFFKYYEDDNVRLELDLPSSLKLLKELVEVMERRQNILRENHCKKIQEFNKGNKKPMKHIVLVIDEFSVFSGRSKPFNSLVVELVTVGRSTGIHVILTTQRPDPKTVTGQIKSNIEARICFKVADAITSRVVLGKGGAEKLSKKGQCLLQYGVDLLELQTPLNPDTKD